MSKITGYTAAGTVAADDLLVMVDVHDTSMASSGTDKKMTFSQLPAASDWLNVKTQYGAKGNGKTVTDAVMTAASATLTSSSAGFTSADAGKLVTVALAGVVQPPAAPSLATATTGGTVAAGTYQVKITYVNVHGETTASASASIATTGAASTLTIASPIPSSGCTGWYAYVTQSGGSSYTRQQAPGSPTAIGANLTLTAPPTNTGAAPPGSNTATGDTLSTTIAAYVNSTTVTLSVAAAAAVSGATAVYGTDDTAAINAMISAVHAAGGGAGYLPGSGAIYMTSAALTMYSSVILLGAGGYLPYATTATMIYQASTTADGIDGWYILGAAIRDLCLCGPGSGSGIGINFTSPAQTISIVLSGLLVEHFGGHGIYVWDILTSTFTNVTSYINGGDGFHVNGGTSTTFTSCWGGGNAGYGWNVNGSYMTWNSCAADANANGWLLTACQSCTINGSGTENNTTDGLTIAGGYGITVNGFWVSNNHYGVHVTSTCYGAVLTSIVEANLGSAVYSIYAENGSNTVVLQANCQTAQSVPGAGSGYTASLQNGIVTAAYVFSTYCSIFGGGIRTTVNTKTSSYTLGITDSTVLLNAATLTATLPTAVGISGQIYTIKLIAASTTGTVATTSSQTIDGATTYSLSARYKYVTVQSDGANWQIIANN